MKAIDRIERLVTALTPKLPAGVSLVSRDDTLVSSSQTAWLFIDFDQTKHGSTQITVSTTGDEPVYVLTLNMLDSDNTVIGLWDMGTANNVSAARIFLMGMIAEYQKAEVR